MIVNTVDNSIQLSKFLDYLSSQSSLSWGTGSTVSWTFDVGSGTDPVILFAATEFGLYHANVILRRQGVNADFNAIGYDGYTGNLHSMRANGTMNSPTAVLAGETVGGWGGRAYTSAGSFHSSSPAAIHAISKVNQTGLDYGMFLKFLTTPAGSTTRVARAYITDVGDFNIGTEDNPIATLIGRGMSILRESELELDLFSYMASPAAPNAGIRFYVASGTKESPAQTKTTHGGFLSLIGRDNAGNDILSSRALITLAPAEDWTTTNQGSMVKIETVPLASTTRAEAVRIDGSTTSGNTRLMLYDVDNATLERVTVGAPDSGGSGYKVLRIPN